MSELHCLLPQELSRTHTESGDVELKLHVSSDIDYFKGHFPNAPILAGVVQLDWAIHFARQYLDIASDAVKNVEVLKFQVVIQPEQDITLILTQKSEHKFTFKYISERGVHASGRIVIEEA